MWEGRGGGKRRRRFRLLQKSDILISPMLAQPTYGAATKYLLPRTPLPTLPLLLLLLVSLLLLLFLLSRNPREEGGVSIQSIPSRFFYFC